MSDRRIAFFDLDRTLISVNSASLWIKREVRQGHLSKRQALRGGLWILQYNLGMARMEDAVRAGIATLQGVSEDLIAERTRAFWDEEVVQTIRPGARAAVQRHRERGDGLVLLTSSSSYLSQAAVEELGLDDFLCTRFEVVDGVFTGQPVLPLCFGPGKVEHARRCAEDRGVNLEQCSFYTDSMSDLPPLLAVGEPVVVHPDPRLAREAKKRGWRVEDWQAA